MSRIKYHLAAGHHESDFSPVRYWQVEQQDCHCTQLHEHALIRSKLTSWSALKRLNFQLWCQGQVQRRIRQSLREEIYNMPSGWVFGSINSLHSQRLRKAVWSHQHYKWRDGQKDSSSCGEVQVRAGKWTGTRHKWTQSIPQNGKGKA